MTEPYPDGGCVDATATEAVERVVARRDVQDALSRLPSAHREVIELAYFQGHSQREIAARLGVPIGTVKSRTFAGLRVMRSVLAPHAPDAAPSHV